MDTQSTRFNYANTHKRDQRHDNAQSLVEFVLVAPLFLLIIFVTIDLGRAVYIYGSISATVTDGARIVSLPTSQTSDCYALQQMESRAIGFTLLPDPDSLQGNSNPNDPQPPLEPQTPPANIGYIYIWPADATSAPQDVYPNCQGNSRQGTSVVRQVAVQIEFTFVPLTPISFITASIPLRVVSVIQTEY